MMANSPSGEPDNDPPTCPTCGGELEWVECDECCGDGEIDEHTDDPINFAPGEEYRFCYLCKGQGGWLECTNTHPANTEQESQ